MRKIKTRKIHECVLCLKKIPSGSTAFMEKEYHPDDAKLYTVRFYWHFKCEIKKISHIVRFRRYREKCKHPGPFRDTHYRYIQGEVVQEPDYDQCRLCNARF